MDRSVPLTNSLANQVKIDSRTVSLDLLRHRLIIVTTHYNNEDFYLNGALICKVRPETQTEYNLSTFKKTWGMYPSPFPQIILLRLY